MIAVMKREIKNYLKRPLFWIEFFIVLAGVFQDCIFREICASVPLETEQRSVG